MNLLDDNGVYSARGTAAPRPLVTRAVSAPQPVFAYTPPCALVTEVPNAAALVRGAWTEVVRKVLGLKVTKDGAKGAFFIKAGEMQAAVEVFGEKQIAPAAWLAWRAAKLFGRADKPPGLSILLGIAWLREPRKRGWFRTETTGLFGLRATLIGTPPDAQADAMAWQAYYDAALVEKDRTEAAWKKRVAFGGLFPTTDVKALLWRDEG